MSTTIDTTIDQTPTQAIESTTLYFREGSSDKVYQAAIERTDDPDRYLVTFAHGRRGSTMNIGTKTPQPVDLGEAQRIHANLIASKLRKGYTRGKDGTPYSGTGAASGSAGADTGIRPQLANPVSEEEAQVLLKDGRFCLQEKIDGRRMLVRRTADEIIGINRRGLRVALPEPIARDAAKLPGTFLLDGEAVGDTLHVFDLLERDGINQRGRGVIDRLAELEDLLHHRFCASIVSVPPAFTEKDKRALWAILVRKNAEGVVFKHRYSTYRPGRPASGGDWLKFKFVETASFIVGESDPKRAGKRSVALELLTEDGSGKRLPAGNVTIPPNHRVPEPGSVVEVEYLYAMKESGSVYQPVYLGPRNDIPPEECTVDQLKFKPRDPETEAAES